MAKKQAPPAAAAGEAPASGGKGKLKLIILAVVALLLVVGASIGGTWFFLSKNAPDADSAAAEETAAAPAVPQKQPAVYEVLVPAFVVNYNYNGRQRYMQTSVALMARSQAELDALKEHLPLLRNRLVMLFSSQDFAALVTPVGKEMLRQQATATVQELAQKELGKVVVEQVLFTNFVLQ